MDDVTFFKLTNTREPNIIDVELDKLCDIKDSDTVEVDIHFAPKSGKITTKNFDMEPFQKHMDNSSHRDQGTYRKHIDPYAVAF